MSLSIKKCFVSAFALLSLLGFFPQWSQAQISLPDLTIDANRLASSIKMQSQVFKSTDCAIQEGCVGGAGKRQLMKFDVAIPNQGNADFFLGSPLSNPLFMYSSCHGHYHVIGFASYELLDQNGVSVVVGRKQAFCLEDYTKVDPLAGPAKYTCSNQGISVGWSDVYGSYLDCQWLDVTGVPSGRYTLKVVVNAAAVNAANAGAPVATNLQESNYNNNTATAIVTIKK